ncbi:MAG: integral rane sensor hybrid histidine kinase [Rickettsiaceae bacterium]|jgi:two-component system CAI-1 autoinducer sensor kinase/phosphatase CqsS|nr:integral rane sensor hybrid histidine kinase [Rickettsiaceae bacterium]
MTKLQVGKKFEQYILFVDDEEKATKYFEKIFNEDFHIITANSAEEALEIVKEKHREIATIITDQKMAGKSGVDLLQHIKNTHPNITRILTTAHADLNDNIAAINQCNIFAYLTKPWDIDEMRAIIYNGLMEFKTKIALLGLSGSIAHEMRNPLNSIANSFEMIKVLLPKHPESHEATSQFDIAKSSLADLHNLVESGKNIIKRSNKIIDSILSNVRGEDIDKNSFVRLSARNVINAAIESFGYANPDDKNLIHFIDGPDFEFLGDQDLLIYALFNLIKNSLYYKDQKPDFKITISIEQSEKENFIKFRDNGIGIPKEKLESIFENFSTSGKIGGTGLGLAFCRRVLRSFNGDIKCDSELGSWIEFTMLIPHYKSDVTQKILSEILKNKKSENDNQQSDHSFINGKKILLADDDLTSSKITSRVLEHLGCSVTLAKNGLEVLNILEKQPVDLILMDIEMPVMNGLDTAKAIRRDRKNKDIPIIAATGNSDNEQLKLIEEAGFNDVLGKPFFKENFLEIAAEYFDHLT